jgi:cytochrome c oxidase subunit 2
MSMLSLRTLGLIVAVAGLTNAAGASRPQAGASRVIEITAERFEFWPSEIAIAEGEEVELRIRSDDTLHGFRIVGMGVNLVVPKRGKGEAVTRLVGMQPGRYTFECSRMCGAGHNFMRGELIVRSAGTRTRP